MNITDIRNQVKQYVDQLSPEKLMVAADFLSYLAERESKVYFKDAIALMKTRLLK